MSFNNYKNHKITITKLKEQKKREQKKKEFRENKGNWEFNFFQKTFNPNNEAAIKLSLTPENSFNPKNVHQYINPEISKEEKILIKSNNGIKLKTTEQIILQNYLTIQNNLNKNDIETIKKLGVLSKPVTKEGKTRLLLYILDYEIKKNNIESIANIYLRLMEEQFTITPDLYNEYSKQIEKMNTIVSNLDLIKLQFTKFHSQMPPLNTKGFKKFDEWQIQVIKNIDNNISTIVNAPTSAGKTVLSGYATTKGNVLFVVPTDALAWQMSSYIGNIIGENVPIITTTYQTNPSRDALIELLNSSSSIVGTSETIVDYLPFIKNQFKWIIFDEVHMIGKPEGSAMEYIAKILPNIPILALSATISNTDELVEWFKNISPNQPINKVICNKRFFNLQRFYYNQETNNLICIHPLALIEEIQIKDRTILTKSLQPTPPNTWDLSEKMSNKMDLGELEPHKYFSNKKRIELDESNIYFYKLIELLVNKYDTDKEVVLEIINSYKQNTLESSTTDIIKLAFKLKEDEKNPTIIFQKNTIACLRIVREFAKTIETLESEKYPKLINERIKLLKTAKKYEKKIKQVNDSDKNEKKSHKLMMDTIQLKKDAYGKSSITHTENQSIITESLQEPHNDFILNKNQYFNEGIVEGWVFDLKKYFPNTGEYYHFIIKLLWRGVGVYAKGLPDPYLRLVQTLATKKQLAIVFSDDSLVFGVSMPFRTVVIVRDDKQIDDLDSMLFHQMSGRAGRRGLDKEGNIILSGYSWNRIKELSISESPNIIGMNNILYTIPHANQLSKLYNTNQNWDNICKNNLNKNIQEQDSLEFLEELKSNFNGGWSFSYNNDNINHLHLNWKLRYNNDCLIASLLIPYLRRCFEGQDHTQESNQIKLAHFLCRFISTTSTKNKLFILEDPSILSEYPYNQILEQLNNIQIDIPLLIDNRLYLSIQLNSLVKNPSEDETDKLRERLMIFGNNLKNIQHYCFHSKITGLSKIMGKLLTRIWWIYHTSSPIMKSFYEYETNEYLNIDDISSSDEDDVINSE